MAVQRTPALAEASLSFRADYGVSLSGNTISLPRCQKGLCFHSQCSLPIFKGAVQVEDFFTHLLQRVVPKHDTQARAEVTVTRRFLENFSGDQVTSLSQATRNCLYPG